ncbi:MAG: 3-deoxy-manno-octulosonate cytidylyltransferase [Nitrospiraceae bacterium]|nr:3-deoxy-manno-octulosonate cytidylyltransferase [Nitrospiraceae bacterium]
MTAIVIIPARYDSTRFPGKPLVSLKGKPIIQHVYENSRKSRLAKGVIVATDSEKIFESVNAFGGKAVMTSTTHESGTDRIAEAASSMDYDIIVNVQGDEPFIKAEMIDDVISLLDDENASIGTLMQKITEPEEILDPNVVKVVCDSNGFAMYFSRAPIPFNRDNWKSLSVLNLKNETENFCFKHIGIYSYRKDVLLKISKMKPGILENIERLEQLRAMVNGIKIKVKETPFVTIGIDTPKDLERAEKWLSISS